MEKGTSTSSIEGLIMIKRKGLWVHRYVTADYITRTLSYRNSASDKFDKYYVDIANVEMMRGFMDKAESRPFITVANNKVYHLSENDKVKRLTKLSI
jgi:hypothetical protein